MVARFGMSDRIGKAYYTDEQIDRLSPAEHAKINDEIKEILDGSYTRAKSLLSKRASQHKILAEALLKEETMSVDQIKERIGFVATS